MFLISVSIAGVSCGPNQRILESSNENKSADAPVQTTANVAPALSSFEQDLSAMRTADFKFILVFRRNVGQPMDAADKDLIGKKAAQANRRRLSDEGRAVLIGSNFPFVTGLFDDMKERFTMENYSKADSGPLYSDGVPNQ
jgi:hypothetical protein